MHIELVSPGICLAVLIKRNFLRAAFWADGQNPGSVRVAEFTARHKTIQLGGTSQNSGVEAVRLVKAR